MQSRRHRAHPLRERRLRAPAHGQRGAAQEAARLAARRRPAPPAAPRRPAPQRSRAGAQLVPHPPGAVRHAAPRARTAGASPGAPHGRRAGRRRSMTHVGELDRGASGRRSADRRAARARTKSRRGDVTPLHAWMGEPAATQRPPVRRPVGRRRASRTPHHAATAARRGEPLVSSGEGTGLGRRCGGRGRTATRRRRTSRRRRRAARRRSRPTASGERRRQHARTRRRGRRPPRRPGRRPPYGTHGPAPSCGRRAAHRRAGAPRGSPAERRIVTVTRCPPVVVVDARG